MMKLYGTVTSERASKGQGGQNFIDLQVRNKDKATILCLTITMENGEPQIKSIGGSSYLLEKISDMLSNQEQETSSTDDKGKCVCTAACGAGLGHNLVKDWQEYQKICKHVWHKPYVNEDLERCTLCNKEKGEKQKGEQCDGKHEDVKAIIDCKSCSSALDRM